jgi:hypothetical protein
VKLIAECCQTKVSTREKLSLDEIQSELNAVEFEDEAIRTRAEQLSSGDLLKDWYSSVGELRLAYSTHYIPEVKRRFGLR